MSASNAPANPGTPKAPKSSPATDLPRKPGSSSARFVGPVAVGALALGVVYTYYTYRAPKVPGSVSANPLRTPGVRNIENAYANGGATRTHTPAYGGTTQGSKGTRDQGAALREGGASGSQLPKNFDTEGVGEDQRSSEKGLKIWNDYKYGNDKSK